MEELLITEPDPPKGAKPINGTAKTIAPPLGAKKKEPTVSEPDSNDGLTEAGSAVSQEPGPKGAQPSGKSGEEDNEYTRYFDAYQEKLGKEYTDKLTQELAPYDQALVTKPNTTDQKSIDEYNQKVEARNTFAEKRAKELDDEFKNTVNTEYQRVVKQAEGFDAAMAKYNQNRIKQEKPVTDLTSMYLGPFGQVPYMLRS